MGRRRRIERAKRRQRRTRAATPASKVAAATTNEGEPARRIRVRPLFSGGLVASLLLFVAVSASGSRVAPQSTDATGAELVEPPPPTETPIHLVRGDGTPSLVLLGDDERELLRTVFGIDDPERLSLSDSTGEAVLRYRAFPPGCAEDENGERPEGCRSAIVRVGLTSPRRPGESWDEFVGRIRDEGAAAWGTGARMHFKGLASLDPEARPYFEQLIADARRAGYRVRIAETYRSPERQTFLLARRDGRTRTPTSVHSYGRAVDVIIGDGRISRRATARQWIAFRRWVLERPGEPFRLVGAPERTWDWGHVELATPLIGFRTIDDLVAAARHCRATTPDPIAAAELCVLRANVPN